MDDKRNFNPVKLMQRAVEVMEKSIVERRGDGKATPFVGAVLRKPDGRIETAYRGELREGDHAEFTLLERKNRDVALDGSVLFITLEPCAPGARNEPKVSCAERIVLARIKEVWVGIEDPDPTVDRKGIKYLQDNGVTVHMFEARFQETIRSKNKDFIAQALERAATSQEEQELKPVTFSDLELGLSEAALRDCAAEALEKYRNSARVKEEVRSPLFNRRLVQQGLLMRQDDTYKPTGFGILLFGQKPRIFLQQAGLLGTIHHLNGQEETRDFDGPLVEIPGQVEQWLSDKLPDVIDRGHMQHRNVPSAPLELVREAVINALVHRDYSIPGAKCQLEVTPDAITIRSPGEPLPPITLEQLRSFEAPTLSRNPKLHYVFAQMSLANERGLGMKTLRGASERFGLPSPIYSYEPPYLVLTIYRSIEGATQAIEPEILQSLSDDERSVWRFIVTRDTVSSSDLIRQFGFPERKCQRILGKFLQQNLLRRVGKGRATRYTRTGR